MILASLRGHMEIVKLMIENGADNLDEAIQSAKHKDIRDYLFELKKNMN